MKFPGGFLWGASTSAHQAEGHNHNDWTEWEQANAQRLAAQAGQKFAGLSPVWNQVKTKASDPANYISGIAADHYHRYEEDFDLAKQLGLTAVRISIEWSRVEPEEGKFDEAAIAHYRKVIEALKARDIEPFVTLWHWPFPPWLAEAGRWLAPGSAGLFARYSEQMVKALPEVRYWITINEPDVYSGNSYFAGEWPPQSKNPLAGLRVLAKMIQAHKAAYRRIKLTNPQAQIGLAKNNTHFQPGNTLFWLPARVANYAVNNFLLNRLKGYQDFIGLNNYLKNIVSFRRQEAPVNDLGWKLYPDSLYFAVKTLAKYNLPVFVTEHGLADKNDEHREWFISESLQGLHRAIKEGVDVRGYLHWSLTDNFEWDKGFWPQFGLIEVDYATGQRRIRPSAARYAEIVKCNGTFPD